MKLSLALQEALFAHLDGELEDAAALVMRFQNGALIADGGGGLASGCAGFAQRGFAYGQASRIGCYRFALAEAFLDKLPVPSRDFR